MESLYKIGDVTIKLKATAATVRNYRMKFGRDFLTDMGTMETRLIVDKTINSESMEVAEMCAYIMVKDADPDNVPDDIQAWLEQYDPYFVYKVIPGILEMWRKNSTTINKSKKKVGPRRESGRAHSSC